jgi:hypothetical protein
MKGYRNLVFLITLFALTGLSFGQETSTDNPFPEIGKKSAAAEVFDLTKQVTLSGVVNQRITRPVQASASILYFRFNAVDSVTRANIAWTVRIPPVPINCIECLIDDYQPEMDKLTVGTKVTVIGNPARDQSRRLSLVPQRGPDTISGIKVIS